MSWLSAITALVKLSGFLAQWSRARGLINDAQRAQLADLLLAEAENVDAAFKARMRQRLADAGGVSDEDPDRFRRD